jgi:hypothetical protein
MSMAKETSYGDLEIALNRRSEALYDVQARLWDPEDESERPAVRGQSQLARVTLDAVLANTAEYAKRLTDQLFEDERISGFYRAAKTAFEARGRKLRLRIVSAPELHRVRWELLLDPETRAPFATSEHVLLSRFMPTVSSMRWWLCPHPPTLTSMALQRSMRLERQLARGGRWPESK